MTGSRGWRGAVLGAGLAALALAGCGDEESPPSGGELAALAPSDAFVYLEGAIRPEGDKRRAIEAIARRFPGGEEIGEVVVSELDESIAEEAERGEEVPTWEEDIAPWLGDRGALVVRAVKPQLATDEAGATFILPVTDPDAAAEAIPRLAEVGDDPIDEREDEGVTYYLDEGDGDAAGLVGDYLVAASTEQDFLATRDSVEGDAESLADRDDFTYEIGETDGSRALTFGVIDLQTFFKLAVEANSSSELASTRFSQGGAGASGFEPDEPVAFAVEASDDEVTIEAAGAVDEELYDPARNAELLGSLPADSSLALDCAACLQGFFAGFAQGAAASGGVTPEDAREALEEQLGFDLDDLEDATGSPALFIRGESLLGLGGAAVIEVKDQTAVERALGGLRRLAEGAAPASGTEVRDLPAGFPEGASGFSLAPPSVPPVTLLAVLSGDRLVVGVSEEATRDALDPKETLEESGGLGPARELGSGYEPMAIADLDSLFSLIGSLPGTDDAKPYLEPFAAAVSGAKVEDGRLLSRTVVTFD